MKSTNWIIIIIFYLGLRKFNYLRGGGKQKQREDPHEEEKNLGNSLKGKEKLVDWRYLELSLGSLEGRQNILAQ